MYQSGIEFAQEWATAIGTSTQVSMSAIDTEHYLRDLVHRLEIALSGPVVDTQAISEVGAELVAGDFIEPQSLSRTVEILAKRLPAALPGTAGDPLPELLGALVAGYLEALRNRIFHQQQWAKRALLATQYDLQRDVQTSQARFSELFNSSDVGIAISRPDGSIVRTNPALDSILGYPGDELSGRALCELFAPDDLPVIQQRYRRLVTGEESRVSTKAELLRKDGQTAWVYLTLSVLNDEAQDTQHVITMAHDITELHLLRRQFAHHLLHDEQTGLPNRQYFVSHLKTVAKLLRPSAVITLMHLDLDGFSVINDGLGHRFGDQALGIVARRLESVVADQEGMVARLTEDEYAILIQSQESVPDIRRLAETINSVLAEPFALGGLKVALTATIGVVQRQAAAVEPAELLRAASMTLHRSQRLGLRQWAMFDADVGSTDSAELRLAAALPAALENGQLRVDYQPVVSLDSGQVVGVEAVLSWQHPELGVLPHERCVQFAERIAMVHAVGRWLLHTAADQARVWRERTEDRLPPMVIGLTPQHARDPDLVEQVGTLLRQLGIPPNALELRVPVTALRTTDGTQSGEGVRDAEDNVHVLADLGVHISLHDFTGCLDGLARLAELPVHTVRIAQSLGDGTVGDPSTIQAQALHALVTTMRTAGIHVVACRVDTEQLANWWRSAGADSGVGALFGAPGPPEEIERLFGRPIG